MMVSEEEFEIAAYLYVEHIIRDELDGRGEYPKPGWIRREAEQALAEYAKRRAA